MRESGPRQQPVLALVVAAGGAIGGTARLGLNTLWSAGPEEFPWATVVENVSGCLLLGVLMVIVARSARPRWWLRPFFGVGVLGGYTTFSAYTAETLSLLQHGRAPLALVVLIGSVGAGLLAAWAGMAMADAVVGGPRS